MRFVLICSLLLAGCGADGTGDGDELGRRHGVVGVLEAYSTERGTAGVLSYSRRSYGGYFESRDGDGVRGISVNNDGGKFSTASYGHGAIRVENSRGPQIIFSGEIVQRLPDSAPPGSLMAVRENGRLRLAFAATESEWVYVTD